MMLVMTGEGLGCRGGALWVGGGGRRYGGGRGTAGDRCGGVQ